MAEASQNFAQCSRPFPHIATSSVKRPDLMLCHKANPWLYWGYHYHRTIAACLCLMDTMGIPWDLVGYPELSSNLAPGAR